MRIAKFDNNQQNINFKQIYRIKMKKGFNNTPHNTDDAWDFLSGAVTQMINISTRKTLKRTAETGQANNTDLAILRKNIHKKTYSHILLENPIFYTFQTMSKGFGYGIEWIANNIRTEIPTPLSKEHNTFTLYMGEDGVKTKRLTSKLARNTAYCLNSPKILLGIISGHYKLPDFNIWQNVLFAKKLTKVLDKKFAGKQIEEIALEKEGDLSTFYDKINAHISKTEIK